MHNICHYVYDENVDRNRVQKSLDEFVAMADWQEGCKGLDKPIRWLDSKGVYPDENAALRAVDQFDRGWYDQLAVRFYGKNNAVKWLVKIEYHT